MSPRGLLAALVSVAAIGLAGAGVAGAPSVLPGGPEAPPPPASPRIPPATAPPPPATAPPRPAVPAPPARPSRAVGLPHAGRLVDGVRLPAEGAHFVTWDPIRRVTPNRPQRRWATDRTTAALQVVAASHRAANPGAARIVVGDLSRPRGGPFGARYGGLGHRSHQNGLDVDVYLPRRDRAERAPGRPADADMALAQDLVHRFLAMGAQVIFVGPGSGLRGPRGRVQELVHHERHMHVRFPNPRP